MNLEFVYEKEKKKIKRDLPSVGTKLMDKFFTTIYHAEIVEDNKLPCGRGVKFHGKIYSSMTAAAKAITKQPTNGWRFWKIQKRG